MILPPVKWANRGANFVHETPTNRGAGLSLPITGFPSDCGRSAPTASMGYSSQALQLVQAMAAATQRGLLDRLGLAPFGIRQCILGIGVKPTVTCLH